MGVTIRVVFVEVSELSKGLRLSGFGCRIYSWTSCGPLAPNGKPYQHQEQHITIIMKERR